MDACGGVNNTNCCAGNGDREIGNQLYEYIENACEDFTGSVCKDGSCMGFDGECLPLLVLFIAAQYIVSLNISFRFYL